MRPILLPALATALLTAAALVPATAAAAAVPDRTWEQLAGCESDGDWHADTGNGFYGGLQIWPATWAEAGGLRYADRPDRAPRRHQITVAEEIRRRQGWGAWPDCARELGLLR
ncbi:transglycosylase family protein [Kitasatospora sp. NPDC002040]|uniref:transglycosylase family protein n=1 Tax=Kitasatospora sp. NPDC002040 TaxID=3154661 RepID=UPI00332F89FA